MPDTNAAEGLALAASPPQAAQNPPVEPAPSDDAPVPSMALLAGLVFALLFYVAPGALLLKRSWMLMPALGESASFLVQMAAIFALIWATLVLVAKADPSLPGPARILHLLATRLNRATGQSGRDLMLLGLCVVSTAYLVRRGAWLLVPLGGVGAVVFSMLLRRADRSPWPIKPYLRNVPAHPPQLPPVEEKDGKVVELRWRYASESVRPKEAELEVFISHEAHRGAEATNPSSRLRDVAATPEQRVEAIRELVQHEERSVLAVARRVAELGRSLTLYEQLGCALSLVQSIPYTSDEQSKGKRDYWRYPVETLYDGTGDCEDKAILLAAIFNAMYRVPKDSSLDLDVLVLVSYVEGHAAVAVGGRDLALPADYFTHDGRRYFLCETTSDGAVGAVPASVNPDNYEIISVRSLV